MTKLKATALILALCLSGCPLKDKKADRTPNGWRVKWKEQGTLTTGLHTQAEVYALFDAAMERSFPECAAKVGLPEGYIRSVIQDRDALYTLVDNFYWYVGPGSQDSPNTVYASGVTFSRYDTWVAFYNKAAASPALPTAVPVNAPSWTLKDSTSFPGQVYWGEERPGEQYPALGYELHWQFTLNP
jgi:hypothetical protein